MKNFLITGSLGFMGYNLSRILAGRFPMYSVVGLDAEVDKKNLKHKEALEAFANFTYIKGDVLNKSLLDNIFSEYKGAFSNLVVRNAIDIVYSFAFESMLNNISENGMKYYENNIVGALNSAISFMAHGGLNKGKKYVYISSSDVYGYTDTEKPFSEDFPLNPLSINGSIRLAVESLLISIHKNYSLPLNILRITNYFGPGLEGNHILMDIIKGLYYEHDVILECSPFSIVNAAFSEDLFVGIESVIPYDCDYDIVNLSGYDITYKEFVDKVISILDTEFQVKRDGSNILYKSKLFKNRPLCGKKALEKLGWKNYTDADYGIYKTIRHMIDENNS